MKQLIFIFMILFIFSQNVSAQNPNMCVTEFNAIEGLVNEGYLPALDITIQAYRVEMAKSPYEQIRSESRGAITELQTCKSYLEGLIEFINNNR